jgi:pSer/pThr/pTyr-binding forkhead associated (FHA) protein
MAITCPNCNADLPDDAVFCDQCGASLGSSAPSSAPAAAPPAPVGEDICPQCGASTIPGEAFCDSCGASLAEPQVSAAPPAVVEPEPVPAPAEASPDLVQCPACGAENLPDSRFCSNCGIVMEPAVEEEPPAPESEPEPVPEPAAEAVTVVEEAPELVAEPAVPEAPAPIGRARFIVRDSGAEITLPTAEGEYIIGREDPVSGVFPTVDMNPHDGENLGVSRRHAQLTVDAGLYFIQDLDSTNFTFLDRKKLAPFTPAALSNGDEVRLGKLVMTFLE